MTDLLLHTFLDCFQSQPLGKERSSNIPGEVEDSKIGVFSIADNPQSVLQRA